MRNLTAIIVGFLLAGSLAGYAQTSLVGKWHGTDKNLPIIDLDIEQHSGQATGTAIFYVLKSNSDGSNLRVDGQAGGPMENLSYAPNQLTFAMHRKDGSVATFRVVLDNPDHARLLRVGDDDGPGGSVFPLVRINPK